MKSVQRICLLLALVPFSHALARPVMEFASSKIIYGIDNRVEVEDYGNAQVREQAKSVAGMVARWKLSPSRTNPDELEFPLVTFEREFGLCEGERFSSQVILPVCSGFLVAPDVLVTAGHCIESEDDCQNFKWVFGYTQGMTSVNKDSVYGCKEIIKQKLEETKFTIRDYAVIRLDRKVTERSPLKFRKFGRPMIGTDLYVIGHPSGLPMKISDGATVKGWNRDEWQMPIETLLKRRFYLQSNLDTYQGNSGSPVFNQKTGKVEGILIEGADDFVFNADQGCHVSARRSNSKKESEERIFRINKVGALKEL